MTVPKYQLVEHPNSYHDKHWSIEILDGDYAGLVYQYDTISLREEDNGEVVLDFNVINLDNPVEADLSEEKVSGMMGDILVGLIEQYLKEQENNVENGNTDTEESNSQ